MGTDAPDRPSANPSGRSERDRLTHLALTLGKVLGVVVTLVTLVGGIVTVLFQMDPTLEPCVGGGGVTFTSVNVVPNYPLREYFWDVNRGTVPPDTALFIGAEVRYSYTASNLSGNGLRLYLTLEQISPQGDVRAPPGPPPSPIGMDDFQPQVGVPGQPQNPVRPDRCSEDSSGLDWIYLPRPVRKPRRYQIILEFYRGARNDFTDRVGVSQTSIFDA